MAGYRTPTHYYRVDGDDVISPRERELSGTYAPNYDESAPKRRFRMRLHPVLEVTGLSIQDEIEAQRARACGETDDGPIPVTGFITSDGVSRVIHGTGSTVEQARAQAVDAIRDICRAQHADDVRARRAFTALVRDLDTYPATAALIGSVRRGETEDWKVQDGAACTYDEAHVIEAESHDAGMRPT